jgi:hypothetical protein
MTLALIIVVAVIALLTAVAISLVLMCDTQVRRKEQILNQLLAARIDGIHLSRMLAERAEHQAKVKAGATKALTRRSAP